ncbi:hypothetical protein JCM10213_003059 [Rhodosporidiobolus nylandii]
MLLSLPPELVSHILLFSAVPSPSSPLSPARQTARQLSALSLVCRSFRPIAQRALLLHLRGGRVELFHARELERFGGLVAEKEGEGGMRDAVRALEVELWGEEWDEELEGVVQACGRVDERVLSCVERLPFARIAAGENLTRLSLRQSTLVPPWYPSPPPSPLPSPTLPFLSSTLRSLSLHLCSLRRHSLPTHPGALPNLANLLLFTGNHDQSFAHLRAFLRPLAAQLRGLSMDYTAFHGVFPPASELDEGEEPIVFPALEIYGLYFDAAYLSLVSPFPSPSSSTSSTSSISSPHNPFPNPPPNLHLSLYPSPSALPVLYATLVSLLEPSAGAAGEQMRWTWRGVRQLRFDSLVHDMDGLDDDGGGGGGGAAGDRGEETAEEEEEGGEKDETKVAHLLRLAHSLGVRASVDPVPRLPSLSPSPLSATPAAGEGAGGGRSGGGGAEKQGRATFARGFGTGWWRFVAEVEAGGGAGGELGV